MKRISLAALLIAAALSPTLAEDFGVALQFTNYR